jgi:hypothetical protein
MKLHSLPLLLAVLTLEAGLRAAIADTIKLKNGTVLEGTITKESTDSVTIEVKEKGVTDWVTVKKADAASITKATADEKEAADILSKLNPSRDGMTAQEYDKAIKAEIQPWLDKYKTSPKRKEMEELLKLYSEELTKAKAGEIKLRGAWITVDEKKWNEYNVNARKLRVKIETLLKEKKYAEAYATFAQMEVTGGAGVDFPPMVEAMKKALPALEAAISNAITAQPELDKQRKSSLASMTADQKKNEELRIALEKKDWTARVAKERKDKYRILTFYPYDLKNIQDTLTATKKEVQYLAKLDLTAMTAANKKFEQGLKDLNSRAWLSAKSNFEAAAKFHTKDPIVKAKLDEATKGANAPTPKPGAK